MARLSAEPQPTIFGSADDGGWSPRAVAKATVRRWQGCIPARLRRDVLWALTTSVATCFIALWCLRPETRGVLPSPASLSSFGAFVTVFLTSSTVGRTLRNSADALFGSVLSIGLAWLLAALLHGRGAGLALLSLFCQSCFWAYVEIPVPTMRFALSTMVIASLGAYHKPAGMPLVEAAGIVCIVAVSSGMALLAVLVPLGPQWALSRACSHRAAMARILGLLVRKTCHAFLEEDASHRHIATVQLRELARAAHSNAAGLAEALDDAQWEPSCWRAGVLDGLRTDQQGLLQSLALLDGMQRALAQLKFNACHRAFALRLGPAMEKVAEGLDALMAPGTEAAAARRVAAALELALGELLHAYGTARRELLYPEAAFDGSPASRQAVSWRMEDLLYMNAFLFTLLHLATQALKRHRTQLAAGRARPALRCRAWCAYARGLMFSLRPPWPPRADSGRLRAAFRFAFIICLAAAVDLAPVVSGKFEIAIWAPVEVTFLMFRHGGGSLRQAFLRMGGAFAGSVVGYLLVLFIGADHREVIALCLAAWAGFVCLFRSSPTSGYAMIVAAWTAVIVADVGVAASLDSDATAAAATAALERVTHTVVGAACLLLGVSFVFPRWARDSARHEVVASLAAFGRLFDALRRAWVERSQAMAVPGGGEEAGLLEPQADSEVGPGTRPPPEERLGSVFAELGRRLPSLRALVTEASLEPSLCRPPFQAAAAQEVSRNLGEMSSWLKLFGTYVLDMPAELRDVFGGQEPRRWLSKDWVQSLHLASGEIGEVLSGLEKALQKEAPGARRPAREQPYLRAIKVEGLEAVLRSELGELLNRYDWIFSGTISDSQLKILAGTHTEAVLTNVDVLLYNSLVFAMCGFVEQLLGCSRAIRELTVVELSTAEEAELVDLDAISGELPEMRLRPHPGSRRQPATRLGRLSRQLDPEEAADMARVVLTVVGPDRIGIVHDIARAVFGAGGAIAASRTVQLDDAFAVVMRVHVPSAVAEGFEAELQSALPGFRVAAERSRDPFLPDQLGYELAVKYVCPRDTPGLLMRFTALLMDAGLNIVSLDTELVPTPSGAGFVIHAQVSSPTPIDEELLSAKAAELGEGSSLSLAVPFSPTADGRSPVSKAGGAVEAGGMIDL